MQLGTRSGIHRLFLVLGLLVVGWSTAQALGPAHITNWPAPATWSPQASSGGGRTALATTQGPPVPLIPVAPCRVMDTRGNGQTGNFGPPQLGVNVSRTISIPTHPTCTGIPSTAGAYSLNLAVTNTGSGAFGYLQVWPTGQPQPVSSNLNYPGAGATLSNAAVVQAGTSGQINVFSGNASADVIIDVNGYYDNSVSASSGYPFSISGPRDKAAVIYGINAGFPNWGYGVIGYADSSSSWQDYNSAGVLGYVQDKNGAIGVKGVVGTNLWNGYPGGSWGVVGAGGDGGVYGVADMSKYYAYGVKGGSSIGPVSVDGTLGYKAGATQYGVYSNGNFGGTGAKYFVEPHPTDADKVIRYVALEGPEAGTYFRGTAQTAGKQAVIEVPESFRIVTDEEGLTVQLTPVGELAQLAVITRDLNQIVVRSSRDVTFDYHVHGVRRAFKAHEAIAEGSEFRPASPNSRLPSYLTEEARKRLVENGTYNRDGTVNLGTAQRRGWTKVWEEEARKKSSN